MWYVASTPLSLSLPIAGAYCSSLGLRCTLFPAWPQAFPCITVIKSVSEWEGAHLQAHLFRAASLFEGNHPIVFSFVAQKPRQIMSTFIHYWVIVLDYKFRPRIDWLSRLGEAAQNLEVGVSSNLWTCLRATRPQLLPHWSSTLSSKSWLECFAH